MMVIKRVGVSVLRDDLAKALRKVEHEGFGYVLCRHRREVAALVPMPQLRRLLEDVPPAGAEPANQTGTPDAAAETADRGGYWRRLRARRRARRARRAERAAGEAAADKWAWKNFRGMDGEV